MRWLALLCGVHSCLAAAAPDQMFLERLFNVSGGWARPSGFTADACTWTGETGRNISRVKCAPVTNGNVIWISLPYLMGKRKISLNFTGPEWPALSRLEYLDLSGNMWEGNINDISLTKFPKLRYLRLSENAFTGTLTTPLPTGLEQLDLAGNRLSGNISALTWPSTMRLLFLQNSGLQGSLHSSLLSATRLERVQINNMALGSLGLALLSMSMTMISILELQSCGVTGTFPLSIPITLKRIDLRDNNITGPLPWSIFNKPAIPPPAWELATLDLSNNQLTGITGLALYPEVLPMLNLDLSNNNMMFDLTELAIVAIEQFPYLSVLNVAGNKRIYGDASRSFNYLSTFQYPIVAPPSPSNFAVAIEGEDLPWERLIIFNASDNNLTGAVPVQMFSSVQIFDLSRNRLSGSLPASLFHSALRLFALSGNELRAPLPPDDIPNYVSLDKSKTYQDLSRNVTCSQVNARPGVTIDVDWVDYLDLSAHCSCIQGHVYTPSLQLCSQCARHVLCTTKIFAAGASVGTFGSVETGFYPVDGLEGELSLLDPAVSGLVMLECRHADFCNPQQPPPGSPFACAEGHDINSRLCSQCITGYYSIVDLCYKCTGAAVLSPLMTLVGVGVLTVVIMRKHNDKAAAGTLQIVLTWIQITRILSEITALRAGSGLLGGDYVFPGLYSMAVLSPVAIECALGTMSYQTNQLFAFFSPLLFLAYCLLVVGLVYSCRQCRKGQRTAEDSTKEQSVSSPGASPLKSLASRCCFLWGFLSFAFYFQFCLVMLRSLTCEDLASLPAVLPLPPNVSLSLPVLQHAPYVRCQEGSIQTTASFGLLYCILLPLSIAGVMGLVKRKHPENWMAVLDPYFGFLLRHLRPEAYLWDIIMVSARKFGLAIAVACFPRQGAGAIGMPLMIIAILIVGVLAQTWVRPYKSVLDNALEMFLLGELLLAFFVVVLAYQGEKFFYASDLAAVDKIVVFITWLSAFICLLAVLRPLWARICSAKKPAQDRLADVEIARTEQ